MTVDEFVSRHSGDYVELIDGEVVPLIPAGMLYGVVAGNILTELGGFVKAHRLGVACSNDTFVLIRRDPPRVRGADFCFWRRDVIPPGRTPALIEAPPELCVEMQSPTYDWRAIHAKVTDYLAAGVKVILVVDPETRTAVVYRPTEQPQAFSDGDELTLPDVLPGFAVPVRQFFE